MNKNIIKAKETLNEDLNLINAYSRKKLTAEEVYTFSVRLCDNDLDRDYELFSITALEKLKELFVGKTGIFDHERKSGGQTGRIYNTRIVMDSTKKNVQGKGYSYLEADVYIPINTSTESTIEMIEAGILKEVSVGCSVEKSLCSICGKEVCTHQKGKSYGDKLCFRILEGAKDAYEFSFVAVPAQRNAGVIKSFGEEEINKNMQEKIKKLSPNEEVVLSFEEIKSLRESAQWGESYREKLSRDFVKFVRIAEPELSCQLAEKIAQKASFKELEELRETYKKIAERTLPISPQLKSVSNETADNNNFRI